MKNILLLHGALGSKEELQPLERTLSLDFNVHSINFHGHGGAPFEGDFSIELFAQQVLHWMEAKELDSINIVGYSLGGFVGLYIAKNYPDKVDSLTMIGTKLYWDVSVADKEIAKLDPETIKQKVPAFAAILEKLHAPQNWHLVLSQTAAMFKHLGQFSPVTLADYSKIEQPVLLIIGDRDKMVTLVETTTAYKELPQGQLAVLPSTPHAMEHVDVPLLASMIKNFLKRKRT